MHSCLTRERPREADFETGVHRGYSARPASSVSPSVAENISRERRGRGFFLVNNYRRVAFSVELTNIEGIRQIRRSKGSRTARVYYFPGRTLILDRNSNGCTLYGRGLDVEEIESAVTFDAAQC